MHVRVGGLRLLAALMASLWLAAVIVAPLVYRPGGPLDALVALGPLVATTVAAAAILWPPAFRSHRASRAVTWLGIGTLLVLFPTVAVLAGRLADDGAVLVLPAPESLYAWLVSLAGTALYGGLGLSRRITAGDADSRRRVALGVAIAVLTVGVTGSVSIAVVTANDAALRGAEHGVSDWGPIDPLLVPPPCDGPLAAGPSADVEESGAASSASRTIGTATLAGVRQGSDSRWTVKLDGWPASDPSTGAASRTDYRRSGGASQVSTDGGPWLPAPLDDAVRPGPANPGSGPSETLTPGSTPLVPPNTLDQSVIVAALPPRLRAAAGDLGIELVGGARARHCRLAIDGPTALAAFRPLRALVGQDLLSNDPALGDWRGELDWWVFGDGELGKASVAVGGLSPGAWPGAATTGSLTATLTARHRGSPVNVAAEGP